MRRGALAFVIACMAIQLAPNCTSALEATRRVLTEGLDANTPSAELFLRAYEVFSHPRCSGCHPRDDRPRWGTITRLHGMNVQRGEDRPAGNDLLPEGAIGRTGMNCSTCHQEENGVLPGSPPGAHGWRLAPARMGWAGLSAAELCRQFKALVLRDGHEDIDVLLGHIVKPPKEDLNTKKKWEIDPLVSWAWNPGPGRDPAPGTVEQFVLVLRWWKDGGASCPSN
jgi:hypothetical protein